LFDIYTNFFCTKPKSHSGESIYSLTNRTSGTFNSRSDTNCTSTNAFILFQRGIRWQHAVICFYEHDIFCVTNCTSPQSR